MANEQFERLESAQFHINPTPAQQEFLNMGINRLRFVANDAVYGFVDRDQPGQLIRRLPEGLYQAPALRDGQSIPQFWTQPLIDYVFADAQQQSKRWERPLDQAESSMYDHGMALMVSLRMADQSSVEMPERIQRLDDFNNCVTQYLSLKTLPITQNIDRYTRARDEINQELTGQISELSSNQLLDRWVQLMLLASITALDATQMGESLSVPHSLILAELQSRVGEEGFEVMQGIGYLIRTRDDMFPPTPAEQELKPLKEPQEPVYQSFYLGNGLNLSGPTLQMVSQAEDLQQGVIVGLTKDAIMLNDISTRFKPEEQLHERMYIYAMSIISMLKSRDTNLTYGNFTNYLKFSVDSTAQYIAERTHSSPLDREQIELARQSARTAIMEDRGELDLRTLVFLATRLIPLTVEAIDDKKELYRELTDVYAKLRERARAIPEQPGNVFDTMMRAHFRYGYRTFRLLDRPIDTDTLNARALAAVPFEESHDISLDQL